MIPQKKPSFNGPRFAQCKILAEGNIAHGRVLEQIYYYARNCWVPIGNQRYTAPTTDHLVWELGICKRAVYNAISSLKSSGVIEVRYKKIGGAKRRCIRLLKDPCDQDIGPEPGKSAEIEGEVHAKTHTSLSNVHALHPDGAPTAFLGCTTEHLLNKKKKETKKKHGPETDHAPETGQPPETGACDPAETFSGEATLLTSTPQSPPPPEDQTALVPVASANQLHRGVVLARLLIVRHGWSGAEADVFVYKYAARLARERIRQIGSNDDEVSGWPAIHCQAMKEPNNHV